MNTKHLKAKILDLAIRGKLVPQDPSEGNAADLLKEHNNIPEDEIPFVIPENWCWCRLYNLASISTGSTPLKSNKKYYENGNIPFVTSADTSKKMVSKVQSFITQLALEENHLTLNPVGSLIVAMYGEGKTRGQITELAISAATNQACAVIQIQNETIVSRAFIKNFFLYNYDNIRREAKGGNQANLNLTNIGNIFIPLPPLSEQRRIVSAIEKAFEQIDILEKNKLNLKTYIKQTKSKVLDLAIRGKLVEQNPGEGNASDLLDKSKIESDELPFEIPKNWCWTRLNKIANIERGGSPRPIAHFITTDENGINWIKIGDTKKGSKYIENVKEKIIPEGIRHSRFVHAGDFLLTNSMSFGRPYILKVDGCIHDGWLVFGNINNCINADYLFQLLSSPFIYNSFTLSAAGSTVKNLNIDRVKQVLFPLPPLAEQKRIIAKIELIFEQLDILEKSLGE